MRMLMSFWGSLTNVHLSALADESAAGASAASVGASASSAPVKRWGLGFRV